MQRSDGEGDLTVSNDKTYAGVEADCAHQAKLASPLFQSCLRTETRWADIRGTYRFRLNLPRRPVKVVVRDAGSSGRGTRVHTAVRRERCRRHGLERPGAKDRRRETHLRPLAGRAATGASARSVHPLARAPRDGPGCPNGQHACGSKETTYGEQGSAAPGDWNVYFDAAGTWTVWGSGLLRANDGQVFRHRPVLDVFVQRGRPWRGFAFARDVVTRVGSR